MDLLRHSYFAVTGPLELLDRWLNPYKQSYHFILRGHTVPVDLTRRARKQLSKLSSPLIIELQLYFSCVIQKRVIFNTEQQNEDIKLSDRIYVRYRVVQSDSCNPDEFAKNHPIKQELHTSKADKMLPSRLEVDFKGGQWRGMFSI